MENLNLVELLKYAPKGTKLYSPICGECKLVEVSERLIHVEHYEGDNRYSESFYDKGTYYTDRGECLLFPSRENRDWSTFKVEKEPSFKVGGHVMNKVTGEVRILTSKSRNQNGGFWTKRLNSSSNSCEIFINDNDEKYEKVDKFDPKWLKPFDRVLVRDEADRVWRAMLFSHMECREETFPYLTCDSCYYKFCIPYNEETKHLVGTSDKEPEFYKI